MRKTSSCLNLELSHLCIGQITENINLWQLLPAYDLLDMAQHEAAQ